MDVMDRIDIVIKERKKERFRHLQDLLARKEDMTDEEFVGVCMMIRNEYLIQWGVGALSGKTENMGAYSDFVRRAQDALEAHYRILETRARTRILTEPQREFISVDKETRKQIRAKLLRVVS